MSSQTSEIIQVDNAWGMKKGFVSFLLKIPFIGIRKKLHHFLKSMLDRGLSSNFSFFLNDNNPPKFQKKVEVEFAFLYL